MTVAEYKIGDALNDSTNRWSGRGHESVGTRLAADDLLDTPSAARAC